MRTGGQDRCGPGQVGRDGSASIVGSDAALRGSPARKSTVGREARLISAAPPPPLTAA